MSGCVLIEFEHGWRRIAGTLGSTFNVASLLMVVGVEVKWIGHVLDREIAGKCHLMGLLHGCISGLVLVATVPLSS